MNKGQNRGPFKLGLVLKLQILSIRDRNPSVKESMTHSHMKKMRKTLTKNKEIYNNKKFFYKLN